MYGGVQPVQIRVQRPVAEVVKVQRSLMVKKSSLRTALDLFCIVVGIFLAGFGLEGFLLPNLFIDGGVTGVSMLAADVTGIRLSIFLLAINLPFVVMGYFRLGGRFAILSMLSIVGLACCLQFVHFPIVTNDKLLAAVFGGAFLGAGIGLAIRGGSVLDGTEVLALLLSRRFGATVGEIIFVMNVAIFGAAGWLLGIEPALYSMLTYLAASRTTNFILYGVEEYTGVVIVSAESELLKAALLNELGRGVTVYRGKGGYTETEQDILFCVVTRLEIPRLRTILTAIDPSAFTVFSPVNDLQGGVVKQRAH
jgi:uncharacterized membrane-anchored protein YitT (DUF2179 family)